MLRKTVLLIRFILTTVCLRKKAPKKKIKKKKKRKNKQIQSWQEYKIQIHIIILIKEKSMRQ